MSSILDRLEKQPGIWIAVLVGIAGLLFLSKRAAPPPEPESAPTPHNTIPIKEETAGSGWIPAETYADLLAQFQALQAEQQFSSQSPPPSQPGGDQQVE